MHSLNTLYFPGTALYSIRQYPLFLLFAKIHLIRAVEENPAASGKESPDSFIKSGFCQEHTPCPLGEDRNRFLHLMNDISHRQDDYAAQLSSLVLASQSSVLSDDEDSERAIISSLHNPEQVLQKRQQTGKEEKLWQARLVLAMGEILDSEEEEIARNLAILDDDQAALFQQLHGEGDEIEADELTNSPFAELGQVKRHIGAAHSGNIKKRFKAWKTLFLESNLQGCEIFLTSSRDGGDILLELYEQKTGLTAPLLAGLALPGLIGMSSEEALQAVLAFWEENQELMGQVAGLFTEMVHEKNFDAGKSNLHAISEAWNDRLETAFPARQFGRIAVSCYLMPAMACATLVGGSYSGDAENGLLIVFDEAKT